MQYLLKVAFLSFSKQMALKHILVVLEIYKINLNKLEFLMLYIILNKKKKGKRLRESLGGLHFITFFCLMNHRS